MYILVINCGSSSIKAAVLEHESGAVRHKLHIERLGQNNATCSLDTEELSLPKEASDHQRALSFAIPLLKDRLGDLSLSGVAHRVVHGGDRFQSPTRIDREVEEVIEKLGALA